jgi:hypothetical protein
LQGKRLVFVTNNSTKSRAGYLGKFTGLGLNVNAVSTRAATMSCCCCTSRPGVVVVVLATHSNDTVQLLPANAVACGASSLLMPSSCHHSPP